MPSLKNSPNYLQDIRSLPAVPGKTIYVAGDKEALAYENNIKNGIEIDDRTLEEIEAIAAQLKREVRSIRIIN